MAKKRRLDSYRVFVDGQLKLNSMESQGLTNLIERFCSDAKTIEVQQATVDKHGNILFVPVTPNEYE